MGSSYEGSTGAAQPSSERAEQDEGESPEPGQRGFFGRILSAFVPSDPASETQPGRPDAPALPQLPGLANLPVSLLISYRDGGNLREVMVDHGKVNQHSKILLSGVARLPVKQKIEDMQVRLRSAVSANSLIVEELFVQAVELAQADSRQALA